MYRPANQVSLFDAAELLGCSYFTVRRMIDDGRLAGRKAKVRGSNYTKYSTTRAAIAEFLRPRK